MMNKKILIIIIFTITIIAAIFICEKIIITINNKKNIENIENAVKQGIEKLSKEAKNNLNYEEFLEDVKSVKNGNEPIYAEREKNNVDEFSNIFYYGNGYSCQKKLGGDCIIYNFYSSIDNQEIYSYIEVVPLSTVGDMRVKIIEHNIFKIISIGIVIISFISCIRIYNRDKSN